jgi:hypothetical protein
MKKRIIVLILVLIMAVCMFPCYAIADYNPYADEVYYKENLSAGSWGGTGARYKTTTSKVYVYPSYSPSGITLVQTVCYVSNVY